MSVKYRIFETKGFVKDLEEIKSQGGRNILKKLSSYVYPLMHKEPHFGPNIKKLTNWQPDTWRYRVGDWRFFYQIDEKDKIVFMTAAHHRKESY